MEFTSEQKAILASEGNIKINAIAGSGKTTTVIEYAKSRPADSKILYLAFNKTVKQEAIRKFEKTGLTNVRVETAHSLAFHHKVKGSKFELTTGYKSHQIKDRLALKDFKDKHTAYILANHINKFVAYFCNSSQEQIKNLNYLDALTDPESRDFAARFYDTIEHQTRLFLAMMKKQEIPIIHDFYLKLFQLDKPNLPYDYILFDEGQDASPAMLDVFLRQENTTKVIVGDTHQQIYGWRYAVNSLEMVDFPAYTLSKSFRFDPEIALMAEKILDWKKHLGKERKIRVLGSESNNEIASRAVIARSNLYLLIKAIELLFEQKTINSVYFEGNFQSYTYADEGASLYDVLSLYNGRNNQIRDPLIRTFETLEDLEDYIKKTGDAELSMLVEIVKKYGKQLPRLIKSIKEHHVKDEEKDQADMVFSTVHRCKGMEYDEVTLVNDFINEEQLKEKVAENPEDGLNHQKLEEEVNLLYVAITRTCNQLHMPSGLMPESRIKVLDSQPAENQKREPDKRQSKSSEKGGNSKLVKAGQPWSPEEENRLKTLFEEDDWSVKALATEFERTQRGIQARLRKLGLIE